MDKLINPQNHMLDHHSHDTYFNVISEHILFVVRVWFDSSAQANLLHQHANIELGGVGGVAVRVWMVRPPTAVTLEHWCEGTPCIHGQQGWWAAGTSNALITWPCKRAPHGFCPFGDLQIYWPFQIVLLFPSVHADAEATCLSLVYCLSFIPLWNHRDTNPEEEM